MDGHHQKNHFDEIQISRSKCYWFQLKYFWVLWYTNSVSGRTICCRDRKTGTHFQQLNDDEKKKRQRITKYVTSQETKLHTRLVEVKGFFLYVDEDSVVPHYEVNVSLPSSLNFRRVLRRLNWLRLVVIFFTSFFIFIIVPVQTGHDLFRCRALLGWSGLVFLLLCITSVNTFLKCFSYFLVTYPYTLAVLSPWLWVIRAKSSLDVFIISFLSVMIPVSSVMSLVKKLAYVFCEMSYRSSSSSEDHNVYSSSLFRLLNVYYDSRSICLCGRSWALSRM